MRTKYAVLAPAVLAAAAFVILRGADSKGVAEDRLWRLRNLGKAFYEHPTTSAEAVTEFKKALDMNPNSVRERLNYGLALVKAGQTKEGIAELERAQKQDPKLPHTWFNLGIVFKKEGRHEDAIRQFKRMVELVPDEPVSHYNLGLLYNMTGNEAEALKEFQTAHRLNPRLVAPTFQLYNTHRLAGREAEAAKALALFQETKQRQKEADESEDMEWSYWSEIYDPIDPKLAAEDVATAAELKFQDVPLGKVDPKTAGMIAFDYNGDGRPDLLAWSSAGIRLYRNGSEAVAVPALAEFKSVVSAAAGDFDNDGFADVCVLTDGGAVLLRNEKGRLVKAASKAPAGRFRQAVWTDFDHDYDLDLLLLGEKSVLMRNEGEGGFNDRTSMFPFASGKPLSAVSFRLIADSKGFDLAVSYQDRPGVLYLDRMGGKFEAKDMPEVPAGAEDLQAGDIDNDSWVDLVFRAGNGPKLLMNRDGKFQAAAAPAAAGGGALLLADLENRAIEDLATGATVHRNEGVGKFAAPKKPFGIAGAVALAQADFDLDGRTDVAAAAPDGSLHLFRNQTPTRNLWLRVGLTGVKNLKLAPDTEVEVKAGARYQKKVYRGFPLLFGMRSYKQADTVRITWPNGMIQNEPKQPTGAAATYKEAPKLSGSCPMVFTWNGTEMQFISDVLGVAPLGASSGDGKYFPLDHDEYIQVPGEALKAVNGRYDVRITEELKEIGYIDQVRLIALDHPADVDVFTNDKFKAPPFPEFRLFGAKQRVYPVEAAESGRDVLVRVVRRDRIYPDGFRRDLKGMAEMHSLELDFGAKAARDNRAVLILNGWVDWADGSTFLNAAQQGKGGLILPYLQVKDAAGKWKTVIEDMGIPSGGPKTIAVDLTGKFLSASREVRIVTNLCLYWDEIFLTEDTSAPQVRMTEMDVETGNLRFRGFSTPVLHPERKQPESYIYSKWLPATSWNPIPGLYTRYGETRELLHAIDDRMVIVASGDELKLQFDGTRLPALPSGWKRDFLLFVDGWSKDGDANTAFAENVEPLPFHGMSSYPFAAGERYPNDAAHEAYRREYLTRPPVRVIQPLAQR